jgi:hypothetical protein
MVDGMVDGKVDDMTEKNEGRGGGGGWMDESQMGFILRESPPWVHGTSRKLGSMVEVRQFSWCLVVAFYLGWLRFAGDKVEDVHRFLVQDGFIPVDRPQSKIETGYRGREAIQLNAPCKAGFEACKSQPPATPPPRTSQHFQTATHWSISSTVSVWTC